MNFTVQLGDQGQCVLIDDEREALKPWQVRRIALEGTLFD